EQLANQLFGFTEDKEVRNNCFRFERVEQVELSQSAGQQEERREERREEQREGKHPEQREERRQLNPHRRICRQLWLSPSSSTASHQQAPPSNRTTQGTPP